MDTRERAIRVAHIYSGVENAKHGDRLRLELRRNNGGELRWYDATTGEWIDSHDIKTIQEAMDTLCGWYDNSTWHLTIGARAS